MFRCRTVTCRDQLCPCSRNRIYRSSCSRHCANSEGPGQLLTCLGRSGSGTSPNSGRAATCSTRGSTRSGGPLSTSGAKDNLPPRPGARHPAGRCHAESGPAGRSPRTRSWMPSATADGFSCSHTRRTCHPCSTRRLVVCRSRSTFAVSFADHHAELFLAGMECCGQRCQKQPSTKMATRCFGNAMSIVRRGLPGTLIPTRNLRPRRCSSLRSASSGTVSARRWELILRRTSSLGGDLRDSPGTRSTYDSARRVETSPPTRTVTVTPQRHAGLQRTPSDHGDLKAPRTSTNK